MSEKISNTAIGIIVIIGIGAFFGGLGAGYGLLGGGIQQSTLSIAGSTTVLPIAQDAADSYMENRPWLDIQVSGGGSSTGISSAGQNQVDIGMASRDIKPAETSSYPNLVKHTIAADGIAIIMNNGTPTADVTELTLAELEDIYDGNVTNWNQVGSSTSTTITLFGRDSSSGTRATFDELVLNDGDPVGTMQQMASNGAVLENVASTPGAIGYVGLGYVDENVITPLDIDGVAPTAATVGDGSYPISRNLYMFTTNSPTGVAADFLNFILSPTGQQIVIDNGFVNISSPSWAA